MSGILTWVISKALSANGVKFLTLIAGLLGYEVDPSAGPLIVQLVTGAYALIHLVHKEVTPATVQKIVEKRIAPIVNDPEAPPVPL